ncbi:MAG: hypothetical protein FJ302_09280 [Planctomycetes bacterium]|nr:hypothetical protein [Planctomycetota bacterium]
MTGYTVHSGTTVKFSESWDRIFQQGAAKSLKPKTPPKKKPTSAAAKAKARVKRGLKKTR